MPLYQIQAPNGKTYRIEGPAGASQDDVISAVLQQFPDAGNAPLPPESGIGASFKRGVESLLSTSRTGVEAAVKDAQKAAEAGIARQQETAQRYEAPASLERVKEAYEKRGILGGAAEAISQIPGAIAEQLPQFATMGAGAAAGAAAGAPLGPVGATVGGAIGAALPVLVQAFGGNLQRQVQEGKPVDVGAAAAAAPVQAAADVISARVTFGSRIVGKLLGKSDDALMKMGAEQAEALAKEKLLTVAAKGTAKGAAAEIPTELAQTMLERLQAGLPLTSPDALAEYGDVAYGTALLGPIGALGRLAERAGARQEVARREAEQAETPQTPPLALPGAQPFTPVVFPDGSVATTPEQVAQYEDMQFKAKYAPQPADFKNPEFTPEEVAAEQARRKAEAVPPITPAKEAAGAFAEKLPLFPDEAVYATKPEPTPEPITVTRKDLLDLGISKNAPIIKRIAGLELTDPENLNTVVRELARFAANPSIKPEVATKVREVANNLRNAAPAAQGALSFAPPAPEVAGAQMSDALRQAEERRAYEDRQREEEFRKQEESSRIANIAAAQQQLQLAEQEAQREAGLEPVTGPAAAPAGAGVSVPSERGAGLAPAGVGPSVGAGVDVAGATPAVAVEGAGPQPGALGQTPQPTPAPEALAALMGAPTPSGTPAVSTPITSTAPAAPETEAAPTATATTPAPGTKAAPPKKLPRDRRRAPTPEADEAFINKMVLAYQSDKDVDEPTSQKAVQQLLALPRPKTPEARAAATYFGKKLGNYQLRLVDGLKNIAFDIANESPIFHAERADKDVAVEANLVKLLAPPQPEGNAERRFMSGMSGEAANKAAAWVYENLDDKAVFELRDFIELFKAKRADVMMRVAEGNLIQNAVGFSQGTRDSTTQQYLDAQGTVLEGEFSVVLEQTNKLLVAANNKLGEQDIQTLERHYKAKRDTQKYLNSLRADIATFITKGANAVAEVVRSAIQKIAAIVLALGVVFNQTNFVTDAKAFTIPVPQTKAEVVRIIEKPRADFGAVKPSVQGARVADWVVGTNDAKGKPFIVVDKRSAMAYTFDSSGKLTAATPVLLGKSVSDVFPQGSADKDIREVTTADKVTPAGRFEAEVTPSDSYGTSLKFAEFDKSVLAMHKTYLGTPSEMRQQRLATATPEDNRISYGCINVDEKFYSKFVEKPFADGGVMYIAPDSQTLEQTFAGIAGYSPTVTLVSEIITNPSDIKEVQAHSDLYAPRSRTPVKMARKPNDPLALRTSLGVPLHPAVSTLLGEGDFTGAMRMLAAGSDPRIAKLATRLLNAAVNPKVEIVGDLTDEAGKPVDGLYDPRTNTIKLDSVKGMNAHVLLHETGHSALSHVLDDPNHPVTRQMQALLDNARELLDTAYGAQDVQEFAAEALGNLSFREKLNAINPGGGKITMWQQFSNIVRNFFRRLLGLTGKPIESSLDVVDQLIDEIISPAPGTRDAGVLYAANATDTKGAFRKFNDKAADWTESLPGMTRERADKLHEFTTNAVSEAVRMAYLASLPLKLLSDAASRVLPDAAKISRLVDERSGVIHTRNEQIEALVNRANRWAKAAGEAMVKTFNDVVYFSTINEVDPTRDISYYQPKKITPETLDEFEKKKALLAQVKADFAKLNPEGQKLYASMRDAYKKMYEEIIDSLSTQTSEVLGDDEAAKTIKNQVFRRLLEKGTIDPYFPLTRQGDKWLAYGMGEDRAVEAFESERARDRRIAELEAQGVKNIEKYSKLAQMNYRRAPASSFVADVVRQLKTDKVSEEKIEKVVKLFLDRLPETAFAKGFQAREGTPGFERDAIGAMQRKLFATSRQIANMQYAPKLNKAIAELEEYSKTLEASGQDTRIVNAYIDEYRKRVDFINNPTAPKWSQIATSLGFNMLLGFNISSAFVNLAQVPMVLMPYLGGTYGYGQANRAINNAYKTFFATGRQRKVGIFGSQETETTKAMYSLNNIDFSDLKLPPELKKYEPLVRAAREQGQIDGSQIYDTLEVQGDVSPLAKVNAIGGWMFHHADRINRQVSMLAAYDLELARLNSSKDGANLTTAEKEEKAANYAIHAAEMTQGGTSMASAPRLAQDRAGIGRVLMMFKRYGISMLYLQFKMLREATKSEDKNVRDAARSQFAGLVGMSALFAGMQGIPFFGAAALLYNMFKDDDDDDLETATRKTLGEFMTYGPLSYLTNIDFSGRVSMTDLLLRDMRTGDAPSAADSFMSAFGGPVWGVYTKVERGASLMGQGQMWRGLEQMMPSAIGNVLKGTRYLTEGTNTLRGDPITGDVNSWNVGAQLLGFAPADYQRQLEINNVKKGIDKAVNTEKTSLLRRYYTAQRIGDYEEVADVREKLEELFAKHPGLGSLSQTIERSMKAHERTTKRMVNGIVVSKKLEDELNALGEELGD